MRLLYIVWSLVIVTVIFISLDYKNESTSFYGFAENREIFINSENALEIRKIHVMPGQEVRKGDLLVEFYRPELTIRINEIFHQIEELKTRKRVNESEVRSLIRELEASKTLKISEISSQIKELQARYDMNRALTSELRSISFKDRPGKKAKDPTRIRIQNLKKELRLAVQPIQLKIDLFEKELNSPENPVAVQIKRLEKELNLLNEEKNRLYIFAQVTGVIGSVNFREGEKISPFEPVMTLHGRSPSYIKGFIHENVYNRISVGSRVDVVSLADSRKKLAGEVVGTGARIVEYPLRLRKRPDIQIWGREVLVRIPEENPFLLGEKVLISATESKEMPFLEALKAWLPARKTHAEELNKPMHNKKEDSEIIDISLSGPLRHHAAVEASGVLYLSDLKKYLVISDDTKDKKPVLYLMNEQGIIGDEVVIRGLKKINDMEAIADGEEGEIYIACSQSYNKKGKIPKSRKLLLRAKRDRSTLRLDKSVRLYDLLKEAATNNRDAAWSRNILSEDGHMDIDIEGIFYHGNSLYLGFKSPLKENRAFILRVDDIGKVFEEYRLDGNDVTLWKTFELRDNGAGPPTRISDLYFRDGLLFILSCADREKNNADRRSGNLWRYDVEKDLLSLVRHMADLTPEGITFNPAIKAFVIVSDHGEKQPSKMMKISGLQ